MSPVARRSKTLVLVSALCLSFGLGGCAMGDVELNGGVFDLMGMSPGTQKKGSEPKLAERAPLVVPPKLDRLPAPGEGTPESPQLAEIKDPDEVQQLSQAEQQKAQDEYCKVHYEIPKSRGDDSADAAAGPLGPCRASVLTAIQKWNSGGDEE
jgi:hypothetical protein